MENPRFCTPGIFLSLLFLCSCATTPHPSAIVPASELPADVSINREAGRGGYLIVTLRLADGEGLPFMLDTGATSTVFDKSLEPKLGKCLGTAPTTGWSGTGGKARLYAAPKLYLGNTRLMTGSRISTGNPGILGMDCLKHYCIQLDFEAGKIRFLNPDQARAIELGKAFPLVLKGNLPFIHHVGLLGGLDTNLLIDLGCRIDGLGEKSAIKGLAEFLPDCAWDGETYTNLAVAAVEHANVLGLSFFARHLVTLNFPKRTMYLKQTSVGPLAGDSSMETADDEIRAPAAFLYRLKEKSQLPGLSKDDKGATCLEAYSNFDPQSVNVKGVAYTRSYFNSCHKSATFGFWKNGGSSVYHYQVARVSKDSPWKLQKAWRTDQNGHTIEEYPVP
jgi:hypothetical protein